MNIWKMDDKKQSEEYLEDRWKEAGGRIFERWMIRGRQKNIWKIGGKRQVEEYLED